MTRLVRNERGQVLSGVLNPGGRPKLPVEIREMAQAASPRALAKVIEHLNHEDARVSLRAAEILLDRGYGKCAIANPEGEHEQSLSIAEEHVRVLRDLAVRGRVTYMDADDRARVVDGVVSPTDETGRLTQARRLEFSEPERRQHSGE
jgi:hypothetical protein